MISFRISSKPVWLLFLWKKRLEHTQRKTSDMCTPTRDKPVRAHAEGSQVKDKGRIFGRDQISYYQIQDKALSHQIWAILLWHPWQSNTCPLPLKQLNYFPQKADNYTYYLLQIFFKKRSDIQCMHSRSCYNLKGIISEVS